MAIVETAVRLLYVPALHDITPIKSAIGILVR